MAGGAKGGDDDGIISDINVTPLVDVVLVLLIILMVTAKQLVSQEQIPMELPEASSGEETPQDQGPATLTVSIEQDGTLHLNITAGNQQTLAMTEVTREELAGHARRAHQSDVAANRGAEDRARAIIAADARVSHGDVISIIDVLRTNNVNRFAINVRQPSELPSNAGEAGSNPAGDAEGASATN